MTSASELFLNRRHNRLLLARRNENPLDLNFDSPPSPHLHHHHIRRLHHRSSHTERGGDRFDRRSRHSLLNESDDFVENGRGIRVIASDELPIEVLLARERLLERLRREPASSNNRQHGRDSMVGDQESESSNDVPSRGSLVTDLTSQMGRSQLLPEINQKPPGLTQESIDCLHLEVFSSIVTGTESILPQDCSICLESFKDGDKLKHLPCGHKFHSTCLDPWIRNCGNCPNCRRGIVVNS